MNESGWYAKLLGWSRADERLSRLPYVLMVVLAEHLAEEAVPDEKMKSFIRDLFDEYYPECGDIDGGSLQDMAEKHGILVPELRHEPCGEFCNCNEGTDDEEWKEGLTCYRLAEWLLDGQGEQANECHTSPTKKHVWGVGSRDGEICIHCAVKRGNGS